jgi:hypothetical protein
MVATQKDKEWACPHTKAVNYICVPSHPYKEVSRDFYDLEKCQALLLGLHFLSVKESRLVLFSSFR